MLAKHFTAPYSAARSRAAEQVRPPAAPVVVGGGEFEIIPYHIDPMGAGVACFYAGGLGVLFNGTPDQIRHFADRLKLAACEDDGLARRAARGRSRPC